MTPAQAKQRKKQIDDKIRSTNLKIAELRKLIAGLRIEKAGITIDARPKETAKPKPKAAKK